MIIVYTFDNDIEAGLDFGTVDDAHMTSPLAGVRVIGHWDARRAITHLQAVAFVLEGWKARIFIRDDAVNSAVGTAQPTVAQHLTCRAFYL